MAEPLQNPVTRYPRPPFKVVDDKPEPPPDHGEESYRGSGRLAGRRVLLTGGNSGIGRAAAIAMGREGADVVIAYHSDEEGAQEAVATLEAAGVRAFAHQADLGSEGECVQLVADAVADLGGLDTLVMVAGYQHNVDDILELESEQIERTFRTNAFSLFWLSKAALAHIPPGGSIITTSSVQATQPSPDKLDYAATKAAISNFTKGLAQQLAPKGIRVNCVAPGPVWTNLQPDADDSNDLADFGADAPLGRPGQPAELAGAYVYFASDDASYTTGEILHVAGGMPM
ncbi:SDR family oxidoreductase [Lysobacter korlensis]|uniref:SDR family oxidoreductase n=1 Tax=Lysobacter korlensis TaxID=553636 RepID=A0ABV6S0J3_9GAMM